MNTHIPDSVLTHHLIDQSHGKKGQKRLRTDGDQLFPMMLAILAAFFLIFHLGWQIGVGLRVRGGGLSGGLHSEDSLFSKDKAWMPKTFPEQSTALTAEHDHFREFFSKAILAS